MNKLARLLEMGSSFWGVCVGKGGGSRLVNFLRYKSTRLAPVVPCDKFTPQIARFLMTNRCNLMCSYCGLSKHVEYDDASSRKDITLEFMREAFQTPLLKNVILVDLTGGEPLLVSDIVETVRFHRSSGRMVIMSTNGLLLPRYIKGLKDAGINRINLSIHPGNLSFLKKNLSDINGVYPVHASYVLTRSQLVDHTAEIVEIIEMARNAGCRKLHFWMYFPQGHNADVGESFSDDFSNYRSFRDDATKRFKDFIVWPGGISRGVRPRRCRQLWQDVMITSSGDISPCCGINGTLPSDEANLFSTPVDAIYNHQRLIDLRTRFLDQATDCPEECRNCFLLEHPGW